MPTYNYFCPKCGASEEVYHGMLVEVTVMCDPCLVERVREGVVDYPHARDHDNGFIISTEAMGIINAITSEWRQ